MARSEDPFSVKNPPPRFCLLQVITHLGPEETAPGTPYWLRILPNIGARPRYDGGVQPYVMQKTLLVAFCLAWAKEARAFSALRSLKLPG